MQQQVAASVHLPTFGRVEDMDALDYPAAVDHPGSDQTFVVVLLHEDYLAGSVRVRCRLEDVAKQYDQVRFLCVCAHDAKETLEDTDLPIMLAYQGGKYIGSQLRVGHAEGSTLTGDQIEGILRRMNVRLTAASAMREADSAMLQRLRDLGIDNPNQADADNDSDEERSDDR